MAQAENYCQSLDQATATGRCSTFHTIAILHGHYIIHALASKTNVVCTRTIYLPPTGTSQFSTLTCGLVKSTASLAEDVILFHADHIIHVLASKRNVVCTRTIYLPPTVTSQFSTLTCGLVKRTASLAEDVILFHANHIEVTLFISIGIQSERVEHAQALLILPAGLTTNASSSDCIAYVILLY